MSLREQIESKLGSDEFIYDSEEFDMLQVKELIAEGKHPVCAKCGTRLKCALTPEEARESDFPPGIYCPKQMSHCQVVINFAR